MKIAMIAPLLCLASLPVLSAGAENSVVATLSLPHATVLPGVPFEIDVELENVSSGTARVGLVARLIVTLADGTEIRPSGLAVLGPNSGSTFDASIELAPGQTVQRWISWSRFVMPEWSMDSRHAGPGTYEIALELSSDDPTGDDSSLRTSRVRLVRAFDGPEDEVVWARMQEASGEAWPDSGFISSHAGREIAEEILTSHPSSSYYPYALVLNPIMKRPP
ncbi:MAG: hypothetical protein LC732_09725, partial [Acidobacteria bacterium]|nr:hypothetical protein [Acidobacteriota bacterium]